MFLTELKGRVPLVQLARWQMMAAFAMTGIVSLVIGGWVADSWIGNSALLASPILRAGVSSAMHIAPLVALAAAVWVVILRRISLPLPAPPSIPPPASTGP